MNTLLVASGSYICRQEISEMLEGSWQAYTVHDGISAARLLDQLHPDALVIDLNLAIRDGLSILVEHFPELPPIVLVLANELSSYEAETLQSLGIRDVLEIPCSQYDIARHINTQNLSHLGLNTACGMHLFKLGVKVQHDGFRYLHAAIPLCASRGAARFQKEIYPAVMEQCGASSVECVEHSIRFSIKDAWEHRDVQEWNKYFKDTDAPDAKCPTSKVFITTIARMLK